MGAERITSSEASEKKLGPRSEATEIIAQDKVDLSNLRDTLRKHQEKLQQYAGFFKVEIPNERKSAIEHDLEIICTNQECTVEDVLKLNDTTLDKLKPGIILTIPIIAWSDDYEEQPHIQSPKKGIELNWSGSPHTRESEKLAKWIAENHAEDTSVIFDKKTAQMYIMKNGKVLFGTQFLSGKNGETDIMTFASITDDFGYKTDTKHKITPAGKFPLTMNMSEDGGPISFDYLRGDFATGAVHQPSQKKLIETTQKLQSPSPHDNNTTWGCMVMTEEDVGQVQKFYQQGKTFAYVIPLHGDMEKYIPLPDISK